MVNNNKKYMALSLLLLSLPVLAADTNTSSNPLINFIKEYEDLIKHVITLMAALVTIFGAIMVAKIARKAPDAAVKLEQLKYIDALILEKALSKPELYFVVEEAFRHYFKTHIPIEIIKLLANVEERFYAFSYYAKVGGLISYDKKTRKIKSLSAAGKNLRIATMFSIFALCVHISTIFAFSAFQLFTQSSPLYFLIGTLLITFSVSFGWLAINVFDKMGDVKTDFRRFESKLEGKYEATEVNKSDWAFLIGCTAIVSLFWITRFYFVP